MGAPADNTVPTAKFQIPLPTGTALPHTRGLLGAPATQELALQGFPQVWSFPQTSQRRVPAGSAVARLQAGALTLYAELAESGAGGSRVGGRGYADGFAVWLMTARD
ncbi:rCG62933 [Rattus norvegicus]|uniref:RCG62933 n=1 Tax=Rattus norvegicus TaxID=10116 RepID=A6JSK1_RAT|nr:rCG62933 [Rattus norvegicus]